MSPTTNLKESIWKHVRSECGAEVQACSEAIKKHSDLLDEYSRRSMLPGQADAMVKHLSERALENPNPDMLQAHANVLAGLQAIAHNPSVQFEACRAVNKLYLAAEGPVLALVEAATAALDVQVAELAEVEKNFLAGFGFPYEATAISRLAASLKAGINADAFNRGKEAILNHPRAEVAPQINLANLRVLFEDENA
jgi:hypothetical protein